MSNKDWDPNLTPEQNYVLRQEGTESPGSSPLNNEKRQGSYHCVGCGAKLLTLIQNMKVVQVGHLFSNHYQMYLRKKPICTLVIQEQNIIVKNVVDIMAIFLMMGQNPQENVIATMACA